MTDDWEGGSLEESGKLDNPAYRCKHGTFIGDPYGPDYMCAACELGLDDDEEEEPITKSGEQIRTMTELIRYDLENEGHQCNPPGLYLGVNTGYVGSFELIDVDGFVWNISVKPSERLR